MPIHNVRPIRPPIEITRQGKILLFDERAEDLQRVGELLAAEGHQVQQCVSFSEAVDRLTDESFDMVIIGQQAGLEEEGEVAEWARAVNSRLPVLMLLTDDNQARGSGERWRGDVSEYLMKPASPAEERLFKETVQRYLKPTVAVTEGIEIPS